MIRWCILISCGVYLFFTLIIYAVNKYLSCSLQANLSAVLTTISDIAQTGIFIIALYSLWKDKKESNNIRLSNLCYNLMNIYCYVGCWVAILKKNLDLKIDCNNIDCIKTMYLNSSEFVKVYMPENENIEKSLSFLEMKCGIKVKSECNFADMMHDVDSTCKTAKSLSILKESLRRFVLNSKDAAHTSVIDNQHTQNQWEIVIKNIEKIEKSLKGVEYTIETINRYLPEDMQHSLDRHKSYVNIEPFLDKH